MWSQYTLPAIIVSAYTGTEATKYCEPVTYWSGLDEGVEVPIEYLLVIITAGYGKSVGTYYHSMTTA